MSAMKVKNTHQPNDAMLFDRKIYGNENIVLFFAQNDIKTKLLSDNQYYVFALYDDNQDFRKANAVIKGHPKFKRGFFSFNNSKRPWDVVKIMY